MLVIVGLSVAAIYILYLALQTDFGSTVQMVFVPTAVLFIILIIVGIRFCRRKDMELVLNEEGLFHGSLKSQISVDFVPWEEMQSASVRRITGDPYIVVELKNSVFLQSLNFKFGQKLIFGDAFGLRAKNIDGDFDEICKIINKKIRKRSGINASG